MPIKPENKKLYHPDWKLISLKIRIERANNHCEKCGVANGKMIEGKKGKIVLSVAHLDHNPTNNNENNLLALCQRCHFNHDRKFNIWKSKNTRSLKMILMNG